MTKVLLIQPNEEPNQTKGISDASLPLGLIYIGSALKEKGHEIKILDRNLDPSNTELIRLLKEKYDFVGIGTYTGRMLLDALNISKIIKENSNSIVIWGGFHPTICPEQTLKEKYIDYIIRGEGEETFLEVLRLYKEGKDFSRLNGVNLNPPAHPPDINKLPLPDYSLVEIKRYPNFYVSTSRGCPYKCTFCYNSYGAQSIKPYRNLCFEKVIELLETVVYRYKRKTFTIVDDNFPSDKKRMEKICDKIKSFHIRFDAFSRSNYCDIETLQYLKNAGCWQVQIGVESGNQRILNFLNKGTTVEMNKKAIENCKKVGIFSHTGFMIGLPTETIDELNDTVNFIKKINPDLGGVGIFHPFPKTKLWDYSIEKGLIQEPKSIEEWALKYPTGFRGTEMNVSNIPSKLLIKQYDYLNKFINRRRYTKKLLLYLKNKRLPDYRRVWSTIRYIMKQKST